MGEAEQVVDAGLESPVGTVEQQNNTITLGTTISKTGDFATESNLYLDAYKMTVRDINERGGVNVGGTVYELELKTYDDKSDPTTSRQLFQRLIQQDNVQFLLRPYSSGLTLAVKPIVERSQVPMVTGGAASSKVFTPDNR